MVNLAIKHKDLYPAACEAGEGLLVAPVSTVDCERGFSKQNLIKTCLRNAMSVTSHENLMCISIDGPPRDKFNFSLAFKKWAGQNFWLAEFLNNKYLKEATERRVLQYAVK